MSGWNSYRAVYGAELRAAAREFDDHGWPVIEESATTLLLVTGTVLDVLEVPGPCGRSMCAQLRAADSVVPVAATPTGSWWFPVRPGAVLPMELRGAGVRLHGGGAVVLAPPSEVPDGWVHWRVAPSLSGYRLPAATAIVGAAIDFVRRRIDSDSRPGAERSAAAIAAGTRF